MTTVVQIVGAVGVVMVLCSVLVGLWLMAVSLFANPEPTEIEPFSERDQQILDEWLSEEVR